MTEQELTMRFPDINWLSPLRVTVPGVGEGFACRFCVANYGLAGRDAAGLPQTIEEFDEHMAMFHLGVVADL